MNRMPAIRFDKPDSKHRSRVTRPSFRCRLMSLYAWFPERGKVRRDREPTPRGCRAPPAEPMVRIRFPPAGVMSEPQTIRAQDGRGGWTRAGIGLASDQRTTDQARKAAAGLPWLASGAVRCSEHPPELRHQRLSGAPLTDRRPVVVDLIEKLFFRPAYPPIKIGYERIAGTN